MAKQKSAWRKRFNSRWLRWKLWRAVFQFVPLKRTFSFSVAYVPALGVARETLCNTQSLESADFTPEQCQQILGPAALNDKIRCQRPPSLSANFLRQAAVIPDCAVLGHVGKAVRSADCAILATGGGRPPNWNFAKPKRLRKRSFRDGRVTSLQSRHYFHFIAELLPLLGYLDREHRRGTPLTVLVPADGPLFQHEICAAVAGAYPDVDFAPLRDTERAEAGEYLWFHHASDNEEWLPVTRPEADLFSGLLRDQYRLPAPKGGHRMFFSRGNAKHRRVLNEADLQAIAASHGFERFEAHSANHAAQVHSFGNADVIVAVHGAGLTNLLFARPGTILIEIFPDNFVKSTFLWLAARLGLEYRALTGGRGNYHQAFTVDNRQFAALLDDVSERQKRTHISGLLA